MQPLGQTGKTDFQIYSGWLCEAYFNSELTDKENSKQMQEKPTGMSSLLPLLISGGCFCLPLILQGGYSNSRTIPLEASTLVYLMGGSEYRKAGYSSQVTCMRTQHPQDEQGYRVDSSSTLSPLKPDSAAPSHACQAEALAL